MGTKRAGQRKQCVFISVAGIKTWMMEGITISIIEKTASWDWLVYIITNGGQKKMYG